MQRLHFASCFAADIQKKRHDKVEFLLYKSEINRRNWIGKVLYISLSMSKIEESPRQDNGEKGKNRTRSKLVRELFILARLIRPYASVYIQAGHFTQNGWFLFVHSEKS